MKFLNEKPVITKKAKVLKESEEFEDCGPGIYTVSVSYLATINVKVEADDEQDAINKAEMDTGIEPAWNDDSFIVETGSCEVESLDYGDCPYTDSYVTNWEPFDEDYESDEDDEDEEDEYYD